MPGCWRGWEEVMDNKRRIKMGMGHWFYQVTHNWSVFWTGAIVAFVFTTTGHQTYYRRGRE
jgi:hypothetical protein